MVRLDPPEHTRIRSLTNRAFTLRVVESIRPRIQHIVDALIDDFADQGRCDLISEFAYPLPAQAFAGLIGFPLDLIRRLPNLRHASDESPELSSNNFFRGRTKLWPAS